MDPMLALNDLKWDEDPRAEVFQRNHNILHLLSNAAQTF